MANLYGSVQGARGAVHRLGHRHLVAEARGWNSGIRVEATHEGDGRRDSFWVYQTGGSNGSGGRTLLGVLRDGEFEVAVRGVLRT